jgi:hypothetical protein
MVVGAVLLLAGCAAPPPGATQPTGAAAAPTTPQGYRATFTGITDDTGRAADELASAGNATRAQVYGKELPVLQRDLSTLDGLAPPPGWGNAQTALHIYLTALVGEFRAGIDCSTGAAQRCADESSYAAVAAQALRELQVALPQT